MVRVLLVDDERDITTAMKFVLERKGYHVDAFNDPSLALQHLVGNSHYDIIFSDLLMPEMDGIEFCRRARKLNNKAKFCICTAFENMSDKHAMTLDDLDSNGFKMYTLKKPFDTAELLDLLTALHI